MAADSQQWAVRDFHHPENAMHDDRLKNDDFREWVEERCGCFPPPPDDEDRDRSVTPRTPAEHAEVFRKAVRNKLVRLHAEFMAEWLKENQARAVRAFFEVFGRRRESVAG